jgi:hypothetical protein
VRIKIAIAYRVLYAVAGFAAAATNVLIEKKLVNWDARIAVGIGVGVGLLAFVDNIRLIKFKFEAHERNAARSRMHKPTISALSAISKTRLVDLESLGVSVFDFHRSWVRRYKVIPMYEQRLRRILRFRLSDYPPESAVAWSKGKGAIGECWEKGISILHDRRSAAATFGDPRQATEATFASLTDEQRVGLTYEEFVTTISKYGEIFATPIRARHSGELMGVLSIDCSLDAYAGGEAAPSILEGADIEVFAQRAALLIRDDVARF